MARPIHDWQNKADYPKPRSLSGSGWAWEFLRRNPGYQDAFAQTEALVSKLRAESDSDALFHYEPARQEGENMGAWALRVGPAGRARLIPDVVAESWGIRNSLLPNPFKNFGGQGFSFMTATVVRSLSVDKHGFDFTDPMEAVVIDYRQSLNSQLIAIARYAAARQKAFIAYGVIDEPPPTKKTRSEWPLYLRILDAELAGVDDKEITLALYGADSYGDGHPNATKARTGIATARELRDGGYRLLPRISRNPDKADLAAGERVHQAELGSYLMAKGKISAREILPL